MQIPESTIREIRERADIVDVISSNGVDIKRSGSDFIGLCPFHNEKTPSFHVHPNTGYYKCFGCGKSGDAIAFLQEYQGMTFLDAVTTLAQRCGIEIKQEEDKRYGYRKKLYALLSQVCSWYRQVLEVTKEAQIARDYLAQRNISKETQEVFCIGYAPKVSDHILTWAKRHNFSVQELIDAGIVTGVKSKDDKPYHRFAGRLMFAIKDSAGRVVGFSGRQLIANKRSGKYVNSPETEIFKKGNILYGLDKAAAHITKSAHREAILCEGQIDCIRLHTSGFPIAVAPQGTAFTAEHATVLKRYADSAVLVFDDDTAGHKATIKTAGILFAVGMPVRVISLPDGDDPDTFLSSTEEGKGAEGFKQKLVSAESVISFQYRVAKAQENNPNAPDAIQRVSKAMLSTIALCSNAILKDALLTEAANLLGIPKDVLQDEIGKSKVKPIVPKKVEDIQAQEESDASSDSEDSDSDSDVVGREVIPSHVEFALLTVLACCEGDDEVKAFLSNALEKAPQLLQKFSCDFVRNFISAFLSREEMPLAAFAESLSIKERPWFDEVMASICPCDSIVMQQAEPASVVRSLLSTIFHRPEIKANIEEKTNGYRGNTKVYQPQRKQGVTT